jgi:multiple sugar transport system substrate-binding protein
VLTAKRPFYTLFIICATFLTLGISRIAAQEPVTIRVMTFKEELTDEQIATFEAENPDIQIERLDGQTFDVDLAVSTGDMPDVMRVGSNQIPGLVASNHLLDLTDYFETSSIDLADISTAANYYKVDGRYYGLPKDWSPDFTIWIYKPAFEAAGVPIPEASTPLTYAELADIARKLAVRDGDIIARPGLFIFYPLSTITQILIQHDTSMFNSDFSELQLTSNPVAMEAVRFFYDLSLEGSLNLDDSSIMEAWGEGFPMVQFGYWYGGSIAQDSPLYGQLMMLPAPTWSHDLPQVDPTGGPAGMVISANSSHPDEAYRFFKWYIVGNSARERAVHGWGAPPLLSMFDLLPKESESDKQRFEVLNGELPYSDWQMPIYPYRTTEQAFNDSWRKNIKLAVAGEIDFETFASNLQEEVNLAILNEQMNG